MPNSLVSLFFFMCFKSLPKKFILKVQMGPRFCPIIILLWCFWLRKRVRGTQQTCNIKTSFQNVGGDSVFVSKFPNWTEILRAYWGGMFPSSPTEEMFVSGEKFITTNFPVVEGSLQQRIIVTLPVNVASCRCMQIWPLVDVPSFQLRKHFERANVFQTSLGGIKAALRQALWPVSLSWSYFPQLFPFWPSQSMQGNYKIDRNNPAFLDLSSC